MTVERPNTLAGLIDKRREIAGRLVEARATLRQLIIDLDHIDAAIRLFDPDHDVGAIRPKTPLARHMAMKGDYTRSILDALRDAKGPMTTIELAKNIMAERGMNLQDVTLVQLITRRTGALLRPQLKRGLIKSTKDQRNGRFCFWEIV